MSIPFAFPRPTIQGRWHSLVCEQVSMDREMEMVLKAIEERHRNWESLSREILRATERHGLENNTKEMNSSCSLWRNENYYKYQPASKDLSNTIDNTLVPFLISVTKYFPEAFYICLLLLWPKPIRKGKSLFQAMLESLLLREVRAGTQGVNLEAGTETNTMEKHCLLACSSSLAQDHLPGMAMPTEG